MATPPFGDHPLFAMVPKDTFFGPDGATVTEFTRPRRAEHGDAFRWYFERFGGTSKGIWSDYERRAHWLENKTGYAELRSTNDCADALKVLSPESDRALYDILMYLFETYEWPQ